jgi:hypothetical protein
MYPPDDSAHVECHTVVLPETFSYVVNPTSCPWTQPPVTNHFVPTRDSVKITEVSIILSGGPCVDCVLLSIFDDGGAGGSPGEVLWSDTLDFTGGPVWFTADVSPPFEITDGSGFHVGYSRREGASHPVWLVEGAPWSRQGWEYSGTMGWLPYYGGELSIRCRVEPWVLPPAIVALDPFQRRTVQTGSFDFGVEFRNPTESPTSTRWWVDVYRSGTKVSHLPPGGTWSLDISPESEIERIYGLPVPTGALPGEYTLFVKVGPDTLNPFHHDSVPVEVKAKGIQ